MTKSARQDTSKAAAKSAETEPAERGSAVTQGEATPELDPAAEPAAAITAGEAGDAAKPDLDETKRKFREALERKHQAHNEGQGKGGRDDGKIHGAHGPAASRRNFRRKSG
jgi:Family of unknown function (DUF5302)